MTKSDNEVINYYTAQALQGRPWPTIVDELEQRKLTDNEKAKLLLAIKNRIEGKEHQKLKQSVTTQLLILAIVLLLIGIAFIVLSVTKIFSVNLCIASGLIGIISGSLLIVYALNRRYYYKNSAFAHQKIDKLV